MWQQYTNTNLLNLNNMWKGWNLVYRAFNSLFYAYGLKGNLTRYASSCGSFLTMDFIKNLVQISSPFQWTLQE